MSNTPRNLTRDMLAEFLPNQRAVRAFEQMLKQTGQLLPEDLSAINLLIEETTAEALSASAKANQAVSLLSSISQSLEFLASSSTRQDQPLDDLGAFGQVVLFPDDLRPLVQDSPPVDNLLPPVQVGTLGEQQSNRVSITGGSAVGLSTVGTNNVAFPATQAASSDPNTLDDYEEGSWTPTLTGIIFVGAQANEYNYIKVGRLVHVSIYLSAATSVAIGNFSTITLPFNNSGTTAATGRVVSANTGNACDFVVFNNQVTFITGAAASAAFTLSFTYRATN